MPDPDNAPLAQPLSKTAYVLARLRQELANGDIHPGQQLRQGEIAERYGVSPTPVREALRLLEADGAIRYSPHRGATVTELSPRELRDLYLVRSSMEALLTRLAAERATPDQVADIRRRHEELAARIDGTPADELSRLNREFHLAILRLGSELITLTVVTPLWHGFLPPSKSQWRSHERNARFLEEHERIVGALEDGDADAAAKAMTSHLRTAMEMREDDGDFKPSGSD
jgi:DNA-binding GntR family transcriptional regulator